MRTFKRIMLILLKNLISIVILSAVGVLISYLISRKTDMEFYKVLEYAGFVLIIIGALSVWGNRKIMSDYSYTMTKFAVDVQGSTKSDIEIKFQSYKFTIIMGLSGLVLILISLRLWEY